MYIIYISLYVYEGWSLWSKWQLFNLDVLCLCFFHVLSLMPTQGSFMKLRPVTWVQKLRKSWKSDIKHISAVTFDRLEPLNL